MMKENERESEQFILYLLKFLANKEKDDSNRDQAETKAGDSFYTKDTLPNQEKLKLDTCLADQYKLRTKLNLNLIFYA